MNVLIFLCLRFNNSLFVMAELFLIASQEGNTHVRVSWIIKVGAELLRLVLTLFPSCWSFTPPSDGLFTCLVPSRPPSCLVTVEVANANLNYSFRCYLLVTMLRCFFSRHAITLRFPAVRLLDNASSPTGGLHGHRCSPGRV